VSTSTTTRLLRLHRRSWPRCSPTLRTRRAIRRRATGRAAGPLRPLNRRARTSLRPAAVPRPRSSSQAVRPKPTTSLLGGVGGGRAITSPNHHRGHRAQGRPRDSSSAQRSWGRRRSPWRRLDGRVAAELPVTFDLMSLLSATPFVEQFALRVGGDGAYQLGDTPPARPAIEAALPRAQEPRGRKRP